MISRIPPSTITGVSEPYYSDPKPPLDYPPVDYPPMPAYHQPYQHYNPSDIYNQYNPSVGTLPDEHQQAAYDDEYGSHVHLTSSAAPFARTNDPHSSVLTNPYSPGVSSPAAGQSGGAYDGYDEGSVHDPYASPGSENIPQHHQMFHPDAQQHYQPHGQYDYYHGPPGDDQYDYNAGQAHAM